VPRAKCSVTTKVRPLVCKQPSAQRTCVSHTFAFHTFHTVCSQTSLVHTFAFHACALVLSQKPTHMHTAVPATAKRSPQCAATAAATRTCLQGGQRLSVLRGPSDTMSHLVSAICIPWLTFNHNAGRGTSCPANIIQPIPPRTHSVSAEVPPTSTCVFSFQLCATISG
jgi:hypothetical protein